MAKRSSRERFTELLFYGIVLLVGYLAYQVVWPFLAPLAWAAILAMTLRPVYRRFVIRMSNGNAALLTTVLAGIVIITPAVFLVVVVAQQIPLAIDYVSTLTTATPERLLQAWQTLRARVSFPLPDNPMSVIEGGAKSVGTFLATHAASLLADVLATFGSMLVMLFAMFFFLRDGRGFGELVRRIMPFGEKESERLLQETGELVVASVGAGLIVAFVQGLIGGLAFWILGLPAPAVWGTCIGIASLIPLVGATIVWVPVAAWLLVAGDTGRAIAMTVLCGGILGSVDNVLRPWLLAGRTSASGLVVFIGLLGGASAFGFVGLVVGPIVLVIAGSLIDAMTRRLYEPADDIVVTE